MINGPTFINSPYFVSEQDNWHLKPGAPKEVQEEFNAFMEKYEWNEKRGILL